MSSEDGLANEFQVGRRMSIGGAQRFLTKEGDSGSRLAVRKMYVEKRPKSCRQEM